MSNSRAIGQRLVWLRKNARQTQAEIAEVIGVARSTYGEMETGTEAGGLASMLALADHFKVPLDWLLGRKPPAGGPLVGHFVDDPDELAWLEFWKAMDGPERIGLLAFLRGRDRREGG